jgi:RNA recognition motif-containing protein
MAAKLFVGGLSPTTTEDRLREVFAPYGNVDSASIVTSRDGHSRGFGFVEMASTPEAEEAIRHLDRATLDGRMIKVEWAKHPAAFTITPAPRSEGRAQPAA